MPKHEGSLPDLLRAAGLGTGLALLCAAGLAALEAAMLSAGKLPESAAALMAAVTAALASLLGGTAACRTAAQKRLPVALGTGALFVLVLLAVHVVWFPGPLRLMPAAAAIAGAVTAGLLSAGKKTRRFH